MDVVEIVAPGIEAELHQQRRLDDGDMVVEGPVQVLDAAGRKEIAVYVQHEREYFQQIVPHHAGHRHVVDDGLVPVPEHEHAGNFGEFLTFLQRQVFPGNAQHAVHRRQDQVHVRVNLRRGRQLTVQVAGEGGEHRHDGIHRREQRDHFLRRDVHQVEVEAGLDVVFGPGGIESFKEDISHVGRCHRVGNLERAVAHGHVGRQPVHQQAVVLEAGSFQREGKVQIGRQHNQGRFLPYRVGRFEGNCSGGVGFLVGGVIGIGPHQFVGVDVLRLQRGFQLEPGPGPAACQGPPESRQLSFHRHVRPAGLQGGVAQVHGTVVHGAFKVCHLGQEREGRQQEDGFRELHVPVEVPVTDILAQGVGEAERDISSCKVVPGSDRPAPSQRVPSGPPSFLRLHRLVPGGGNGEVETVQNVGVAAVAHPEDAAAGRQGKPGRGLLLRGRDNPEILRIVQQGHGHAVAVFQVQGSHFQPAHQRRKAFAAAQNLGSVLHGQFHLGSPGIDIVFVSDVKCIEQGFQGQYPGPFPQILVAAVPLGGQVGRHVPEISVQVVGGRIYGEVVSFQAAVDVGIADAGHVQLREPYLALETGVHEPGPADSLFPGEGVGEGVQPGPYLGLQGDFRVVAQNVPGLPGRVDFRPDDAEHQFPDVGVHFLQIVGPDGGVQGDPSAAPQSFIVQCRFWDLDAGQDGGRLSVSPEAFRMGHQIQDRIGLPFLQNGEVVPELVDERPQRRVVHQGVQAHLPVVGVFDD